MGQIGVEVPISAPAETEGKIDIGDSPGRRDDQRAGVGPAGGIAIGTTPPLRKPELQFAGKVAAQSGVLLVMRINGRAGNRLRLIRVIDFMG